MLAVISKFNEHSLARQVAAEHDLTGQRAIVTGGSAGIGVETARALAEIGADVTLAVRDPAAGERIAADINRTAKGPRVSVVRLDLADLGSVANFAADWGQRPLHLLINNAGIMACDKGYTAADFEMQIGVNHFGHSLLSLLLTENLERAAESGRSARLVQLTSGAHRESDIRWDDMHFRSTPYDRWKSYAQSKTANCLFALAFNHRHAHRGVTANAVHPGRIRTSLLRHVTPEERLRRGMGPAEALPAGLKTVEQGAATTVWAALAPELEGVGGLYLEDCRQALPVQPGQGSGGVWPWAQDPQSAERLWGLTAQAVGRA